MRPVFLQWPRRRCDNPTEMDAWMPPPIVHLPPSKPCKPIHQRSKGPTWRVIAISVIGSVSAIVLVFIPRFL